MNLAEILVISVGLSFDVFAVMICEGAMLVRVEKKKLIFMGLIFCGWQLAAVLVGNLITLIPPFQNSSNGLQKVWDGLSVVIFMALGAYMLYKAWKNEPVFETRSAVNYRSTCVVAMATSLDAFFAGIGFGFLDSEILAVGLVLELVTLLFVVLGVYTGYRLGYEQKTKAYGTGGVILMVSGIDVIIRYMLL